jgi:hypothetical protein
MGLSALFSFCFLILCKLWPVRDLDGFTQHSGEAERVLKGKLASES